MADSLATNFTDSSNSNLNYKYVVPNTTLTDTYVLSMTYDEKRVRPLHLGNGGFGIASRDSIGNWVNAVDGNSGGTKRSVVGPWKAEYQIGTYGVDPSTHTAWAVINHKGEFAVARNIEPVPGKR
jgi:hypothetical protein